MMTIPAVSPYSNVQRSYAVRSPVAAAPAREPVHAARAIDSDASLWNVLSDAEKNFFIQAEAMGPLSYGRTGTNPAASNAPIGQRVDVRA